MKITRRFHFDAGHRIVGHESKCANLHGHRYVADVTLEACQLDPLGRVIDFGAVKETVGNWIDENWDHNMILSKDDPLVELVNSSAEFAASLPLLGELGKKLFGNKLPYIMRRGNPTAENIAAELYQHLVWMYPDANELQIVSVTIHETPNCSASYP